MSDDRLIPREVERWVEESSPAAPWLEQNVIDALRTAGAARRSQHESYRWIAATAVFVILALVLGFLVGTYRAAPPTPAGAGSYRAMTDADYAALYSAAHAADNPCAYLLPGECRARKIDVTDTAQKFLTDVRAATPPSDLASINSVLEVELQELVTHMQADVVALSTHPPRTSDAWDLVDVGNIGDAMAEVDCWPRVGAPGTNPAEFATRKPPPAPLCHS